MEQRHGSVNTLLKSLCYQCDAPMLVLHTPSHSIHIIVLHRLHAMLLHHGCPLPIHKRLRYDG